MADWPRKARREEPMAERGRRAIEAAVHNAVWLRSYCTGSIPCLAFPANPCYSNQSECKKQTHITHTFLRRREMKNLIMCVVILSATVLANSSLAEE